MGDCQYSEMIGKFDDVNSSSSRNSSAVISRELFFFAFVFFSVFCSRVTALVNFCVGP